MVKYEHCDPFVQFWAHIHIWPSGRKHRIDWKTEEANDTEISQHVRNDNCWPKYAVCEIEIFHSHSHSFWFSNMDRNITDNKCYQTLLRLEQIKKKFGEKKHWNKFHNLFLSYGEPNLVLYRLFRFVAQERESKAVWTRLCVLLLVIRGDMRVNVNRRMS